MKNLFTLILSVILVMTFVFSLTACGSSDSSSIKESVSSATEIAPTEPATVNAELQSNLESQMSDRHFSGVVRVSKDGVVISEAASGKTAPDSDEDITLDTRFPVGSVSKQFCAAAIMQLKEAGKLSTADTLDKYFPDYPLGKDLTIKDLLTMQSGIPEMLFPHLRLASSNDDQKDEDNICIVSATASEEENRKAIKDWIFQQELDFEPGSDCAYSNSNFFLLADIIEQVSGQKYGDYMKENIFSPLQMNATGLITELKNADDLAQPMISTPDLPFGIDIDGTTFGAGDIVTTAADMDKWLTSLRENTLLSEESIKEMTTDYAPDSMLHYGYGLVIDTEGVWYHEGKVDSYTSYAYTVPESGYNYFAVSNASGGTEYFNELFSEYADVTE